MKRKNTYLKLGGAAEELGKHLKKAKPELHRHVMPGPVTSNRELEHRGHTIEIVTTYLVKVDDKPIACHIHVGHDGHAHTHSLPNYTWRSTVDLVKQLIDTFPDDFPKVKKKSRKSKKSKTKRSKKSA